MHGTHHTRASVDKSVGRRDPRSARKLERAPREPPPGPSVAAGTRSRPPLPRRCAVFFVFNLRPATLSPLTATGQPLDLSRLSRLDRNARLIHSTRCSRVPGHDMVWSTRAAVTRCESTLHGLRALATTRDPRLLHLTVLSAGRRRTHGCRQAARVMPTAAREGANDDTSASAGGRSDWQIDLGGASNDTPVAYIIKQCMSTM